MDLEKFDLECGAFALWLSRDSERGKQIEKKNYNTSVNPVLEPKGSNSSEVTFSADSCLCLGLRI